MSFSLKNVGVLDNYHLFYVEILKIKTYRQRYMII